MWIRLSTRFSSLALATALVGGGLGMAPSLAQAEAAADAAPQLAAAGEQATLTGTLRARTDASGTPLGLEIVTAGGDAIALTGTRSTELAPFEGKTVTVSGEVSEAADGARSLRVARYVAPEAK
jgi:hypothetical protein